MGVVYAAEHVLLGRPAAVKLLLPELSRNREIVQRFFNEARAATMINHPGIVNIYDFGWTPDGSAYIVMELLRGETLRDRRRRGPMRWSTSLGIVRQIAGALGATHAQGIVHRDLKPDNIFLVPDPDVPGGERIRLLDFGIARLAGVEAGPNTGPKTRTGALMGTLEYMAPEQCHGAAVDARADLYALGCILFELCTGRPPFVRGSQLAMLNAHTQEPPPEISSLVSGVPQEIEALVRHMLAKSPDDRVQTADELIQMIDMAKAAMSQVAPSDSHPALAPVPSLSEIPASPPDNGPSRGDAIPTVPSSLRRARRNAVATTLASDEALAETQVPQATSAKAAPPATTVMQPPPDPPRTDTTLSGAAGTQVATTRAPARRLMVFGGLAALGAIALVLTPMCTGDSAVGVDAAVRVSESALASGMADAGVVAHGEGEGAGGELDGGPLSVVDGGPPPVVDGGAAPLVDGGSPPVDDGGAAPLVDGGAGSSSPPPDRARPRKVSPKPPARTQAKIEKVGCGSPVTTNMKTTQAKITIRSQPSGASIYRGTAYFGPTPQVIALDRDDYEFHFEIRLPGYQPHKLVVCPTRDLTPLVKLRRAPAPPSVAPAKSTAAAPAP